MRLLILDESLADPGRLARHLRFSADGRALAAVLGPPDSGRRVVVRYDLGRDRGTVVPDPSDEDEVREDAPDPAVSPDLELVAEALLGDNDDERVRLTDTWAKPPEVRNLYLETVTAVGFTADGEWLLTGHAGPGADDCFVNRFGVEVLLDTGDWIAAMRTDQLALPDGVAASAFADTERFQAVGTTAGTAVLFDLTNTRRPLTVEHDRGRRPVRQLAFTPDGRQLVTRGEVAVAVWGVASGAELARLRGPQPLTGFALTPDGRHLLTCSTDGTVCRFAADSFQLVDRLDVGLGPLHSVAVAPDGLTAAAGGDAGRVAVWDL